MGSMAILTPIITQANPNPHTFLTPTFVKVHSDTSVAETFSLLCDCVLKLRDKARARGVGGRATGQGLRSRG